MLDPNDFVQIQAQRVEEINGWSRMEQLPTFFVLPECQGIMDMERLAYAVCEIVGGDEQHFTMYQRSTDTYRSVSRKLTGKPEIRGGPHGTT